MARRQATFLRQIGDRRIAVEMRFDKGVGAPKLPGCEPRPGRASAFEEVAVGTRNMHMECQRDRIDQQSGRGSWLLNHGHQRQRQSLHDGIVDPQ